MDDTYRFTDEFLLIPFFMPIAGESQHFLHNVTDQIHWYMVQLAFTKLARILPELRHWFLYKSLDFLVQQNYVSLNTLKQFAISFLQTLSGKCQGWTWTRWVLHFTSLLFFDRGQLDITRHKLRSELLDDMPCVQKHSYKLEYAYNGFHFSGWNHVYIYC